MRTRINPPTFNKGKNYERFRQELTAWKEITDEANINLVQKQNSVSNGATAAKLAELQKLRHFNIYEEVNDCGQNTLSTR